MLLLGLLYSFAHIDRINLGLARVAGMGEALVSLSAHEPMRLPLAAQ